MFNTYVEAIGVALQEFQTQVPLSNGEKSDQIYRDLARGVLRYVPLYA